MSKSSDQIKRRRVAGVFAGAFSAALGLFLFLPVSPYGDALTHWSYDLPFLLRSTMPADEVAIVYLDERCCIDLGVPIGAPLDRSLHARLVEHLTAERAKAIVFDFLFTDPSTNAAADDSFSRAIKESGRVILGANFHSAQTVQGVIGQWEEQPCDILRNAAAGWANVNLLPDADYGVRKFFPNINSVAGFTNVLWLPFAAAKFATVSSKRPVQDLPDGWLNYAGPPGTIPSISYFQALQTNGASPGFFANKIIFVGGQFSAGPSHKDQDEFRCPYALQRLGWTHGLGWMHGVEIHATAALNLIRGTWLSRVPPLWEAAVLVLVAAAAGFGLVRLEPLRATFVGIGGIVLVALAGHALAWNGYLWFAWLIPVFQIATALFFAVVVNAVQLYVDKRLLEESLSAHLSPKLVKRLLAEPSLRRRGGHLQEVSVLFSDIANYSRLAEMMSPEDVVRTLNKYFDSALQCFHETDGTVVQLVGDAIFAIWNAPVDQQDYRERACLAALKLRDQLIQLESSGQTVPLRTRIGLHAGQVCVGNVGSEQRWTYSATGDCINLTSRIEGLNKLLGTSILVTREVQRSSENALVWRMVGHFKLKGIGRLVEIYELIGGPDCAEMSRPWREKFADALLDFRQRKFDLAAEKFRAVDELRRDPKSGPPLGTDMVAGDGPSRFYLERIPRFMGSPPPYEWVGEIEIAEK